ncbi:MAG: tRNA lysidine(34) synthetase TilS [Hyphomonadaceae bacterium]|nr:tRNA lysidine(34) synthetase TilS [Hyphomonadaceae bacterium]
MGNGARLAPPALDDAALPPPPHPVLVGFSGGGDSTALLALMARRLGPERLRAVVVDHGLRTGSAAVADAAAARASRWGVAVEVVRLRAPGRAQAAWRRARLEAFCAAARRNEAVHIALGHTADDQAETLLIRAAAGSGLAGLAAMAPLAPVPLWPEGRGLTLARPMLGLRRSALRAWLEAEGLPWSEDPANADPRHTRVRARAALAALEAGGFDPLRLCRLAATIGAGVARLNAAAAAWIAAHAAFDGPTILLPRAAFAADAAALRGFAALVAAAGGADRPPARRRILALAARLGDAAFKGATLGGARIKIASGDRLVLARDPGAIAGRAGVPPAAPLRLAPGGDGVWDARLWARAGATAITLPGEADAAAAHDWLLAARAAHLLGQLGDAGFTGR